MRCWRGEVVAVELAHDVLAPASTSSPRVRSTIERPSSTSEVSRPAMSSTVAGRSMRGDECVGASHGRDAGDVGDEGHVVDVVVHHRALVVEAVRARELTVVRAEEDRRVVQDAQLARHVHDAPDLEVDHGGVAPVHRNELLPLLVRERGGGPVGCVVLLDRGLADEGITEVSGSSTSSGLMRSNHSSGRK